MTATRGRTFASRSLRAFGLAVALCFTAVHFTLAQTQPAPQPAVLTTITASDIGAGSSRVLLTFAPAAPKFSVIANNSAKPSIAFALSTRGSSARAPGAFSGLLRTIALEQNDTILILTFITSSAAAISATPVGDKSISIDVGPARAAKETAADVKPSSLPHAPLREAGDDGFAVVLLKYADVSEVVGLLTEGLTVKSNDSFVPREPAFGSPGTGGGAFTPVSNPGTEAAQEPLAQSIDDAIAIDRRLNAVILKGSPEHISRMKEKIAAIDVPVSSVILETEFVELDESGAKSVGFDFNNAGSQLAAATVQSGSYVAAGSTSARFVTSVSLQAAIYAQIQNGHGRIVSKPRISAQSGSTAKIITGDALPILTSIALSGVNAVSQQVQYVNVGVTLQIAPRVSADGYVTSHVFCVVSSVTGASQGYPTISQREAETSATVRDGDTFVIGGLTEESEISSNTKVPLLASLPLAGALFKLNTGSRSKTELYIVVTPHIMDNASNAARPAR